jgi:hypothetical protein
MSQCPSEPLKPDRSKGRCQTKSVRKYLQLLKKLKKPQNPSTGTNDIWGWQGNMKPTTTTILCEFKL